jgi:hypothetical protein
MWRGASEREDEIFFAKNRKSENPKLAKTQQAKRGFLESKKRKNACGSKPAEIFLNRRTVKNRSGKIRKVGC